MSNKKIYTIASTTLIILFLSLSLVSAGGVWDFWNKITGRAISVSPCIDSDGGINYYLKGFVKDQYTTQFPNGLIPDTCETKNVPDKGNTNLVTSCNGNNCFVRDYYCIGDDHNSVSFRCLNGCQDGACINSNQSNNSYQLSSDFFKSDSTAKLIISGQDYQLIDNNLYTYEGKINTSSFEFKLINAFKQMGYTMLDSPTSLFRRWLSKQGYLTTNTINRDILMNIDRKLKEREISDGIVAGLYEPFSKFLDGPTNEPKKEHVAQIYYSFFNSLPTGIKTNSWFGPMTSAQIDDNFLSTKHFMFFVAKWQIQNVLGDLLTEDTLLPLGSNEAVVLSQSYNYSFKFCAENYYSNLDSNNKCGERIVSNGILSDIQYVHPIIHEFGHGVGNYRIDSNDYLTALDIKFGRISFNITENPEIFYPEHPLRPNNNLEFISEYAKSTHAEDFTESFTAYILEGRIFRERIKSDMYLKQKYEFLKNNVFNGTEYETGNITSLILWNSQNNNGRLPSSVEVYLSLDPNWTWDYNYPHSQSITINKTKYILTCQRQSQYQTSWSRNSCSSRDCGKDKYLTCEKRKYLWITQYREVCQRTETYNATCSETPTCGSDKEIKRTACA